MNKARIGFILGIIVALLIGTADIPGLARKMVRYVWRFLL